MATTEQRPPKSQVNTTWEELDFLDTMLGNAALFDIGDPDNEHRPAVVMVEYAPGAQVPPHHHGCDYLSYVIAGELDVTRVTHGPGSIRVVRGGHGLWAAARRSRRRAGTRGLRGSLEPHGDVPRRQRACPSVPGGAGAAPRRDPGVGGDEAGTTSEAAGG